MVNSGCIRDGTGLVVDSDVYSGELFWSVHFHLSNFNPLNHIFISHIDALEPRITNRALVQRLEHVFGMCRGYNSSPSPPRSSYNFT